MQLHSNIDKSKRLTIARMLVISVIAIEIAYFAALWAWRLLKPNNIVILAISVSILTLMLVCLYKKNRRALFVSYLVVKVLDGVCGPLVASFTFELFPKDTWYGLGKTISYIICSAVLFLTVIFLVINEMSPHRHIHNIIEILTLVAVFFAFLTIIFTIIVVAKGDMLPYELFEPIYECLLFASLFIISPLVHEARD